MKKIILLLLVSLSVQAQECEQSVDKKAKKHYKAAKKAAVNWQYAKAYGSLKQALEVQDDYAEAYYLYGQLKMEQEEFAEARVYLKKGTEICPMYSSEIYWLIGSMAFEERDYDDAARYYDSYLRFLNISDENRALAQERWSQAVTMQELFANPVPFDPKPVPGISTEADEYLPILSPDNDIAFFTRRREKKEVGMVQAETVEEFVVASAKGEQYNLGELMPYPFNLHDNEGGASITIDNNHLYLTICEPENGYNNCDIYYSARVDSFWTDLKRLYYPINKSDSWESQPTISSDGQTLIFASNRPGGVGASDLYEVTKKDDGSWGDLKLLSVNTPGDEKSPFLHPDNQTMYFSSNGHLGVGGMDIFYVKKDTAGEWGQPVNIGVPINSEANDLGFFVSTDGKTAYFASNKLEGMGGWDLYHFPLYTEARPERVLFLKGDVLDEFGDPLLESSIEVRSRDGRVRTIDIDPETGRYVAAITLERDEDVMLTVKDDFYAFNSQYIGADDKAFEKPLELDFDMKEMHAGEAFPIKNIRFETDSFVLTEQAQMVLQSFAVFMQSRVSMRVAIHGHTDAVGDAAKNLALSKKRAQSVQNYLIDLGVDKSRLSYQGFGANKPLASNQTAEGRAKNRRTEFYILEK